MVTDQCERKHSRAFRIRCTDIKEGPFLQALIFAGRNWHFTGLQDQRVGVWSLGVRVFTLVSMWGILMGMVWMRALELFTWIVERGIKYLPLTLIPLVQTPTSGYCIRYHKYPVGWIRSIVSASTVPVIVLICLHMALKVAPFFFFFLLLSHLHKVSGCPKWVLHCVLLPLLILCMQENVLLFIFNAWN